MNNMISTKVERLTAHRAKMARKAEARKAPQTGFQPISGKKTDVLVARAKLNGRTNFLPSDRIKADRKAVAAPAAINRRTGKPHQNLRETARRARQQAED